MTTLPSINQSTNGPVAKDSTASVTVAVPSEPVDNVVRWQSSMKPQPNSKLPSSARAKAAASGELRGVVGGSFAARVADELADFAQRVLTDGTYARAVDQIGRQDPDLANP